MALEAYRAERKVAAIVSKAGAVMAMQIMVAAFRSSRRARGESDDVGGLAEQPMRIPVHDCAPFLHCGPSPICAFGLAEAVSERGFRQFSWNVADVARPVAKNRAPAVRRAGVDPRF